MVSLQYAHDNVYLILTCSQTTSRTDCTHVLLERFEASLDLVLHFPKLEICMMMVMICHMPVYYPNWLIVVLSCDCLFYLKEEINSMLVILLFGLILNVQINNFQSCRDSPSWAEPVSSSE